MSLDSSLLTPTTGQEEAIARALRNGEERPDGRRRPRMKDIVGATPDPAQQINLAETAYSAGGNQGGIIGMLASASDEELAAIRRLLGVNMVASDVQKVEKSTEATIRETAERVRLAHQAERQRDFIAFNPRDVRAKGITLDIQDVKYPIRFGVMQSAPETVYRILLEMGLTQPQEAGDMRYMPVQHDPVLENALAQAHQTPEEAMRQLSPFVSAAGMSGLPGAPEPRLFVPG